MNELSIYKINHLDFEKRIRNLDIVSNSNPPSTKYFPVYRFDKEYIFKPLSYTKPLVTPLFSYSEVIWSYYIKKHFIKDGLECYLGTCHGITNDQNKYQEKMIFCQYCLLRHFALLPPQDSRNTAIEQPLLRWKQAF